MSNRPIIGNTVGTPLNPNLFGGSGVYVGSGEMPDGYNVQINPEGEPYIPTGDGITITNKAEIGQTIKVSEVDSEGKPISWEAVDFPTGGGGEWELIQDFTIEEDCNRADYTVDLQGNPFELKKAIVFVQYKMATSEGAADTGYGISLNQKAAPWNGAVMVKLKYDNSVSAMFEELEDRVYVSNITHSYNSGMATTMGYEKAISVYTNIAGSIDPIPTVSSCPMNAIRIGSYALAMGAGTRVRLWGIRK